MPLIYPIKVHGLLEFERALKTMESDASKTLAIGLKAIANIVYQDALPKIPVKTGRAKGSAKISVTQRRVSIKAGGNMVSYWGWLDFGGWTGRGRTGRGTGSVYRKWMGRPVGNGRYFWHSFAEKREEIQHRLDMLLNETARRAGLDADFDARRAQMAQNFRDRRAQLQENFESRRAQLQENFESRRGIGGSG